MFNRQIGAFWSIRFPSNRLYVSTYDDKDLILTRDTRMISETEVYKLDPTMKVNGLLVIWSPINRGQR